MRLRQTELGLSEPNHFFTHPAKLSREQQGLLYLDFFNYYQNYAQTRDLNKAAQDFNDFFSCQLETLFKEGIGAQFTKFNRVLELGENGWFPSFDDKNIWQQYLDRGYVAGFLANPSQYELDRLFWENLQATQVWQELLPNLPSTDLTGLLAWAQAQPDYQPVQLPRTADFGQNFPSQRLPDHLRGFISKPVVVVSPPSEIHAEGKTSFGWVHRVFITQDLPNPIIISEGMFTGYNQTQIARLLELQIDGHPITIRQSFEQIPEQSSSNEAQLLLELWAKVVDHQLLQDPVSLAPGIFNALVESFKADPNASNAHLVPVDSFIQPAELDFKDWANGILEIFNWEIERCQQDPTLAQTLHTRLNETAKKIVTYWLTGGKKDANQVSPQAFVKLHKSVFETRTAALNPTEKSIQSKYDEQFAAIYDIAANLYNFVALFDCLPGFANSLSTFTTSTATATSLNTNLGFLGLHPNNSSKSQEFCEVVCSACGNVMHAHTGKQIQHCTACGRNYQQMKEFVRRYGRFDNPIKQNLENNPSLPEPINNSHIAVSGSTLFAPLNNSIGAGIAFMSLLGKSN